VDAEVGRPFDWLAGANLCVFGLGVGETSRLGDVHCASPRATAWRDTHPLSFLKLFRRGRALATLTLVRCSLTQWGGARTAMRT
jgi:hypothetical protein